MIKNILTAALIILVSGCTSQALVGKQVAELKALSEYHEAERKEEKAKKAVVVASAALVVAVGKEAEAKKEVKASKDKLNQLLEGTSRESND